MGSGEAKQRFTSSGSFWNRMLSPLNICESISGEKGDIIWDAYRSQFLISPHQTPVDFVLQALYLDVVPQSLDDADATVLFDAKNAS
jgi:hypothetical protein